MTKTVKYFLILILNLSIGFSYAPYALANNVQLKTSKKTPRPIKKKRALASDDQLKTPQGMSIPLGNKEDLAPYAPSAVARRLNERLAISPPPNKADSYTDKQIKEFLESIKEQADTKTPFRTTLKLSPHILREMFAFRNATNPRGFPFQAFAAYLAMNMVSGGHYAIDDTQDPGFFETEFENLLTFEGNFHFASFIFFNGFYGHYSRLLSIQLAHRPKLMRFFMGQLNGFLGMAIAGTMASLLTQPIVAMKACAMGNLMKATEYIEKAGRITKEVTEKQDFIKQCDEFLVSFCKWKIYTNHISRCIKPCGCSCHFTSSPTCESIGFSSFR